MNNILSVVKQKLHNHVKCRDNDNQLVAYIWYDELKAKGYDPKVIKAIDLLEIYSYSAVLTSADTISRARRKVQEENPSLRGLKYASRHAKQEKVRADVNSLFNVFQENGLV